jgi:hypothetical protein
MRMIQPIGPAVQSMTPRWPSRRRSTVVVHHIIPLPLVGAEVKVAEAEALAQKEGRSEEDNKNLAKLLNEARES